MKGKIAHDDEEKNTLYELYLRGKQLFRNKVDLAKEITVKTAKNVQNSLNKCNSARTLVFGRTAIPSCTCEASPSDFKA